MALSRRRRRGDSTMRRENRKPFGGIAAVTGRRRQSSKPRRSGWRTSLDRLFEKLSDRVDDRRRFFRDAPDLVARIIGDENRAALVDGHTYRAPLRIVVTIEKPGQQHLRLPHRLSVPERNEQHAVAAAWNAVPGAMLCHDHAVLKA